MPKALMFLAMLFLALPSFAESPKVSRSARELGRITVTELSIREGKLLFRTDSNGCTDAGSFNVMMKKEPGDSNGVTRYRLTIERIRIDECKALLLDGVLIEMDLEKDLGLKGKYTVSVENPVFPRSSGAS